MKLYSNHFQVEFTKEVLIVTMCVQFSTKQVEFLAANKADHHEIWDFIVSRMRQAVQATDRTAVFAYTLNLESPIDLNGTRRSKMFGSFRVTVRTDWGYPAIFAAFNRVYKLVQAHAKLSGYNDDNSRRRNPAGGKLLQSRGNDEGYELGED